MTAKYFIYYTLSGFVLGTMLLIFIQYNTSKNISKLISGNEKLLDEFKVSNQLKDLEKDIITVESKIRVTVNTKDTMHIEGLEKKIQQIEAELMQLQKISDDDNSVKYIDELDYMVHEKLKTSHQILDSFHAVGKIAAENLIASQRGKLLTDSITATVYKIDCTRKNLLKNITTTIDKSGARALQFSTVLIALVLISAGALFWYIINTIRRQIILINDLNIAEKKEKKAAQIKENFMANMSHEIRTPLNAILGFTHLLQRKKLDDETKQYLQTIDKSGENLLNIINDILDFSKIEAGMMRIEAAPFSIRALLHSVEAIFKLKAKEKQLQFSISIDESHPDLLQGDATRLTQILVNLIGNSLKFTQQGTISVQIGYSGKNNDGIITSIVVADTGIGIDKDKINAVFERFEQADDAVTRRFGGTGLGLSIVKDLVLLQHGTINAESAPGKGTRIYITIPYNIAVHELRNNLLVENIGSKAPDFNHSRILVAEDNEINQSLIKHLFKEWQIEYDIVTNGKDVIDILTLYPQKYNLILMDIQMPKMDGYTATQEIRNELKLTIPIIATTAHAFVGEREKCFGYGMNEYISKPINTDQLYNLISQFIQTNKIIDKQKDKNLKHSDNIYQYINLAYMKEVSAGNIEYEKTVSRQFIEVISLDLIDIETAWKHNDINSLRQLVHNIRTTVSVMGLNEKLDPYLETMEYEDLTEQSFQQNISTITSICNEALKEAREFYASL